MALFIGPIGRNLRKRKIIFGSINALTIFYGLEVKQSFLSIITPHLTSKNTNFIAKILLKARKSVLALNPSAVEYQKPTFFVPKFFSCSESIQELFYSFSTKG